MKTTSSASSLLIRTVTPSLVGKAKAASSSFLLRSFGSSRNTSRRYFSSSQGSTTFLSSKPGAIDVLYSTSNDILFNLATEEYIFEHCNVVNPLLFLWRNDPTIIIGKHQNPWKECHVQKLEQDNVLLARRHSGGGCVYQDLGNTVFSFINPLDDGQSEHEDFKKMNNGVLLSALGKFGVDAKASGRNDLVVIDSPNNNSSNNDDVDGGVSIGIEKKISGSAYKLRLGDPETGKGRRSLHHGTMLIDTDLSALEKYLNPSKKKLKSKGVDSVISRVMNVKDLAAKKKPMIDHDTFCEALEHEFVRKYGGGSGGGINKRSLPVEKLQSISKLMDLYNKSSDWDWRFGVTPDFTNSIEHKFDWALMEIQFNVSKGFIIDGKCYSDCLIPTYIDAINEILKVSSKFITTYNVDGMIRLCNLLRKTFDDPNNEQDTLLREIYTPQLESWLCEQI